MTDDWRKKMLPAGTVADITMPSGYTYRATWEWRGTCCAWWPAEGQRVKKSIGYYAPVAGKVIAEGIGDRAYGIELRGRR